MSYNLIAEAHSQLDWVHLNKELAFSRGLVECFPMPSERRGEADAVGVSLPQRFATSEGWSALSRLITVLVVDFGMSVFDLCSGDEVTPPDLERLRLGVLGGT
jgi:hypothetical protein